MKLHSFCIKVALVLAPLCAQAQGIFVYDQQSGDESWFGSGLPGAGLSIMGQSFTPTLSSVGFIRLYIIGGETGSAESGSIVLNLRTSSITGPILDSTTPVTLPGGFSGTVNFFFSTPVPLTPGNTYYFQPDMSGYASWEARGFTASDANNYPGGTGFLGGTAYPNIDLWFREGIVVPEPSSALLFLAGGVFLIYVRRARHRPVGNQ